jgi:cyclase
LRARGFSGSRHFQLRDLGDGVYAAIATDGGWAVCNAGIIDIGDCTIVFDTFVNQTAALDLKGAAEHVTGGIVDYVVNSHPHRDHVRGNQAFTDSTIIATDKTHEVMASAWKTRCERVQKEGLDPIRREVEQEFQAWTSDPTTTPADRLLWDGYLQGILHGLDSYNLKLPDLTFQSKLTFNGSKHTAEAIAYSGHSPSDTVLYLPDQRTAFLADLFFIGYQPYFVEGDPEELFRSLDKVEALGARRLVPGHGPVGTVEDIAILRDYYDMLQKTLGEVDPRGSRAAFKPIASRFRDWKWNSFYKANLESLLKKRPPRTRSTARV